MPKQNGGLVSQCMGLGEEGPWGKGEHFCADTFTGCLLFPFSCMHHQPIDTYGRILVPDSTSCDQSVSTSRGLPNAQLHNANIFLKADWHGKYYCTKQTLISHKLDHLGFLSL